MLKSLQVNKFPRKSIWLISYEWCWNSQDASFTLDQMLRTAAAVQMKEIIVSCNTGFRMTKESIWVIWYELKNTSMGISNLKLFIHFKESLVYKIFISDILRVRRVCIAKSVSMVKRRLTNYPQLPFLSVPSHSSRRLSRIPVMSYSVYEQKESPFLLSWLQGGMKRMYRF